jgi:hypothetical protein
MALFLAFLPESASESLADWACYTHALLEQEHQRPNEFARWRSCSRDVAEKLVFSHTILYF